MASSALKKVARHLECSICQDKYKRPKVLECQHSFCQKCLENYHTSTCVGRRSIPCPECRRETVLPETGIQGLTTNFQLMGIVEEVSHHENQACSEDKTQGGDQPECQKHMGENTWFYCETCKELICRVCIMNDHPEHHFIDSTEALHKYKQSLKDKSQDLTADIEILQQALVTSSQAKEKFNQNVANSMKAVQDQSAKMQAEIRNQEKKIIEEIKKIQQDRNRTYDEHQKTLKTMQRSKERSLGTSQDIIHNASDTDFSSQYPISTDLKSLRSPLQIDPKLSYLSFIPGQRIGDINLGKLAVKGWEMCAEFGEERSSQKGLVESEGATATQPGEIAANFNLGKLVLKAVKWKMGRKFRKTGWGRKALDYARDVTATQPGEIAVADWGKGRVVICSNEGRHKATISLQHILAVAAIHNPEQRLLVLDKSKYVKVFNVKDNKLAFQFPTVSPSQAEETQVRLWSLAVRKNGTVLVGDINKMMVTEHECNPTGKILRTIPVQTPPYYLAVNDDTDRMVVSGVRKNKADVFDCKGLSLSTIQPTINGQPANCEGLCINSSGIHLAVSQGGYGTGHIHLYDLDGRFVDCLVQGLYYPQGITFLSNGQLAVADLKSIKMYSKM